MDAKQLGNEAARWKFVTRWDTQRAGWNVFGILWCWDALDAKGSFRGFHFTLGKFAYSLGWVPPHLQKHWANKGKP